ncbi:MAG: c-type cytochrome [Pseudomonadales bacterium]
MNPFTTIFIVILSLAISQLSSADRRDEIAERIKPVGEVCLEGDACASQLVASNSSGPRSGADIYQVSCAACHDAGVAGAPKKGTAGDWQPRVANGMDTLYTNAINGLNAMPPKGLCMDCSEDELKATVDFILEQSK